MGIAFQGAVSALEMGRKSEHSSHLPGPGTQSFLFEDIIESSHDDFLNSVYIGLADDVLDTVISSQ